MFEKLTEYLHRFPLWWKLTRAPKTLTRAAKTFIHNKIIELKIGGVGAVLGFFYGVAQWDGLEPVVFWATFGGFVGMSFGKFGVLFAQWYREVIGDQGYEWMKFGGIIILGIVACFLVSLGGVFVLDWMNAITDLTVGLTCFCGGFSFLLVLRYFGVLGLRDAAGVRVARVDQDGH